LAEGFCRFQGRGCFVVAGVGEDPPRCYGFGVMVDVRAAQGRPAGRLPVQQARPVGLPGVLRLLAMAYAAALNHMALSFGCLFLVQAFHGGREMKAPSGTQEEDGIHGFLEAVQLLLGTLLIPFSRVMAAAAVPTKTIGLQVLGFWLPALLGFYICTTAMLGHLTLKFRRAVFVLPYISLAVVQLVWQLELSKVLRLMAVSEDIAALDKVSQADGYQDVRYAMFKAPYEAFLAVYSDHGCNTTLPSNIDEAAWVECQEGSLEGKIIQFAVANFCRPYPEATTVEVEDFQGRVQACCSQGKKAKILPEGIRPQEEVFCRCRAAIFDWCRFVAQWVMVPWCSMLLGICTVLYFAVEPNLVTMAPVQRREAVGFLVVGAVLLVSRLTVFADYFSEDVDEL